MKKEQLKTIFNRTFNFVRNNLLALIIAGFVLWHLFMPDMSYIDICRNDAKIRSLEKEIEKENTEIARLQEEISNTESDINTIERLAREKLGMQRAHEDVYLVVDRPTPNKTDNKTKHKSIKEKNDTDVPKN